MSWREPLCQEEEAPSLGEDFGLPLPFVQLFWAGEVYRPYVAALENEAGSLPLPAGLGVPAMPPKLGSSWSQTSLQVNGEINLRLKNTPSQSSALKPLLNEYFPFRIS